MADATASPEAPSTSQQPTDLPTATGPVETVVETVVETDDLLVEDVSIDGMCGVY